MNTSGTPEKKVNVAVVGLGFMGLMHLQAYLASGSARIVAVCGNSRLPINGILPGITGNVAKSEDMNLGAHVRVYRHLEELLADPEVELVDICTPTPLHPAQTIAALQAGKHVLCEKPLARSSSEAREMVKAAAAAPGFLMPAMCMRFWPGWAWLKEAVQQQTYGKVLTARFRRLSEMPRWNRQATYSGGIDIGGALFDLHIHDTDFVNFLFGRPAGVLSCGVIGGTGSIDHVTTQYLYPGGPAVHAEGNWLLPSGFHMSFTLHCEQATLDFDLARGADALQISEPDKPLTTVKLEGTDGYGAEIRYALECALQGRRPAVVTALDGVTALEICEAEEKSIRTGLLINL